MEKVENNSNLQRLRKAAGFSQSQLAKLAGVNVQVLQQYERGARDLNGIERKVGALFPKIFASITVDNGCEFADAAGMEKKRRGKGKRTEIYYCHPYTPSERGSNENQNGLIRRHIPKGTDLSQVSPREVKQVEEWLNNYPRKMFGFLCSEQLFRAEIAALLPS